MTINDDQTVPLLDKPAVMRLTASICAAATYRARSDCRLIEMIGELDAGGGLAHLHGAKSVAHWVSYACSLDLVTAREHVRVGRALARLPICAEAFRSGELSYSKVRALTRVVGILDDARLCRMARAATAAQLSAMLAGYRRAKGTRMRQEQRRRLSLVTREGGQVTQLTGELATEEAAVVDAALQRARDLNATPPTPEAKQFRPDDGDRSATPVYTNVDALYDICQHYLNTAGTDDESGEDRTLVMIEIAAEQLDDAPAGAFPDADVASDAAAGDASAGASELSQRCQIRGLGGIEPATAQRKMCTGTVLAAIIDKHGDVLTLGRSRRLVTKTQRRALMLRDQTCQYPACQQRRHLDAHHVVPWSRGGGTDLSNLILLCRFHHTCVHEGGVAISRPDRPVYAGSGQVPEAWQFRLPNGGPVAHTGWQVIPADRLASKLVDQIGANEPDPRRIDSYKHPDVNAIRPQQCGEPFDLHACVQALFTMEVDQDQQPAA